MKSVGKKKLQAIKSISKIHDVLIEEWKDDAKFLEDPPDNWNKHETEIYDLLICHETAILKEVERIINTDANKL